MTHAKLTVILVLLPTHRASDIATFLPNRWQLALTID